MLDNFTFFVPAQFHHQFPADPIFCFGKNVKAVDREGRSVLHYACSEKSQGAALLLISLMSDNLPDRRARSIG